MSNQTLIQVAGLATRALNFSTRSGAAVVQSYQNESKLLILWLGFLSSTQKTQNADALLDGACSAVREVAACLSLGMIRPALFSLRTQIDLVLGWIYFKDHPIEWNTVNAQGDGYLMKREVLEYIQANYVGFRERFSVLKEVATRKTDEPYRLLSAHVHAQSTPALPATINLSDVISEEASCIECSRMSNEVSEYLNDVLCAVYASNWIALPSDIQASAMARLLSQRHAKQRFFKTV